MPNAPSEPVASASTPLAESERGDGHPTSDGMRVPTAVAAHALLHSSSVILLAAQSLDERWDSLSLAERREIAARIHVHAAQVAVGLKELARSGELLLG